MKDQRQQREEQAAYLKEQFSKWLSLQQDNLEQKYSNEWHEMMKKDPQLDEKFRSASKDVIVKRNKFQTWNENLLTAKSFVEDELSNQNKLGDFLHIFMVRDLHEFVDQSELKRPASAAANPNGSNISNGLCRLL